jgi:hypothetical protein
MEAAATEPLAPAEATAGSAPDPGAPAWYAPALIAAAVLGSLLVGPYAMELMNQTSRAPVTGPSLGARVYGAVLTTIISTALVAAGLGSGWKLGLGWPPLRGWRTQLHSLALAAGLGIALAAALVGMSAIAPFPPSPVFAPPSWESALLASIGAGMLEEIWLRLGVMTIVASLLVRVAPRPTFQGAAIWTANVIAAVIFGAMHLPLASSIGPLTVAVVAFILVGNGIVGLTCGWLYWRLGIVAAMVSHAATDVVLKVLLPLFGPGTQ